MKRMILATSLLLLYFSNASAQSNTEKAFNKFFVESSAQYWTGVVLDYRSSLHKREANPFLQDTEGHIHATRYFAINSGLFALTVAFQQKYPRAMNWVRRANGWLHIGVSIRNFNVR